MLLCTTRAWVVHGVDGIDELTTTGYTKISECRDGAVNTFYLHPADVGLPKAAAGALKGASAHENAQIIERVLAGDRPRRCEADAGGARLDFDGRRVRGRSGGAVTTSASGADLLATIVAATR